MNKYQTPTAEMDLESWRVTMFKDLVTVVKEHEINQQDIERLVQQFTLPEFIAKNDIREFVCFKCERAINPMLALQGDPNVLISRIAGDSVFGRELLHRHCVK